MISKDGYVYLIGQRGKPNEYKIGMTKKKNVENRLNELQTGNSDELYVIDFFHTNYPSKLEASLHRHFKDNNIINEWFYLEDINKNKFNEICSKYESIFNSIKNNPFFK